MPTPKQMEKLDAEAVRRSVASAPAGPEQPLPPGYWNAVLKDPRGHANGIPIQQRRLSEIPRHLLRVACRRCPTPLSGGDRKALTKELGKARAMAGILAAQSAELRAKGEAMVQQADRIADPRKTVSVRSQPATKLLAF